MSDDLKKELMKAFVWVKELKPKEVLKLELISKNLVFIVFLSGLAVVYIWNSHKGVRSSFQKEELQKELDKYEWEFTSYKSMLNKRSKQSEVANQVKSRGLEALQKQPAKIKVD